MPFIRFIQRKKPLQRNSWLQRNAKPPKKKAETTTEEDKEQQLYKEQSKIFLAKNTRCLLRFDCCKGEATCVQHTKGRGAFLNVIATWLPSCVPCNQFANDHPEEAEAKNVAQKKLTKEIITYTHLHNE